MAVSAERLPKKKINYSLSVLKRYINESNRFRSVNGKGAVEDKSYKTGRQKVLAGLTVSHPTIYMRRDPAREESDREQGDRETLAGFKFSGIILAGANDIPRMYVEQNTVEARSMRRDPSAPDVNRRLSIGSENFVVKMAEGAGTRVDGDINKQGAGRENRIIFQVPRGSENFVRGREPERENYGSQLRKVKGEAFYKRAFKEFSDMSTEVKQRVLTLSEGVKVWLRRVVVNRKGLTDEREKETVSATKMNAETKIGLPILTDAEKRRRRRGLRLVDTTHLSGRVNPVNFAEIVRSSQSNNYY